MATCAGTTKDSFPLGGVAQGCPFSPALWVILADMALCHAHQTPESDELGEIANPSKDGVTMENAGETPGRDELISVKALGYADDERNRRIQRRIFEQNLENIRTTERNRNTKKPRNRRILATRDEHSPHTEHNTLRPRECNTTTKSH